MSTGDRTPYELLAVRLGMACRALSGKADMEHGDLYRFSEKYGASGGIVSAHEAASREIENLRYELKELRRSLS